MTGPVSPRLKCMQGQNVNPKTIDMLLLTLLPERDIEGTQAINQGHVHSNLHVWLQYLNQSLVA